jgi:hypothetical protein
MIRHCVTLTFSPDATAEQIAAVQAGLATLPGAIDAIRAYSFGRDLGLAEGNASFVVVGDFDSVAGYETYRDHPVHLALIAGTIRPILVGRSAVQYEY